MEATKPEERLEAMLLPMLEDDVFLVSIRIKPTNNVKVFLDADSGLNIARCATVNRKLYHAIEESAMYPDGNFSLEVSSPGVDEPLLSTRQYKKNVGRTVEVTTNDGNIITGLLKEVQEDHLVLTIKGIKKEPSKDVEIPVDTIKTTIVQITF